MAKNVTTRTAVMVVLGLLAAACSGSEPQGGSSSEETISGTSVSPAPSTADTSPPPPLPALVYVSVGKDSRVAVLELGIDGTLTERPELSLDLPGSAGAMTYSAADGRLYVGAGNNISTLAVDETGAPTVLGTTPVDGEPVYLDLAAQDRVLAVAFFGEDEVRTYSIGEDLNSYPVQQADAWDIEPHSIVVNAAGTHAYVAHRNANSVGVYAIDESGTLSQQSLVTDAGVGPRHIVLSSDGGFAFAVNEQGDTVTSFTIGADGSLVLNNTVATIPEGVDPDSNTGADIHVSPDGRFVYASNRGHDSIAIFSVDQAGQLTPLGHVPTQARPRDFGMSPDGRFIVVAGQDSGQVESFAIGDDGTLTSVGSVPVGEGPVWVEIV